eukprot:49491_1
MCRHIHICPGRWVSCSRCFHVGKSPMTSWERLKLSPFQKWKIYGLPPWKFFLSILLIIATTANIYLISDTITPYSRAQTENWQSMLIPDSIESDTISGGWQTTYHIYTIDDFMTCLSAFVSTYYSLNTSVVGNYEFIYDNNIMEPATMKLTSYKYPSQIFNPDIPNFDASTITREYNLTNATDYGPFINESNRLSLIHSLISMNLKFEIQNVGYNSGYRTCYVDTVSSNYNFYYRGRIELTMDPSVYICEEEYNVSIINRQIFYLVVFLMVTGFLSVILEFLHIKAIFKHIAIFQLAKSRSKEQFRNLTLSDKLEFFNFWFITTSIANVSNIIGSIWCSSLLLIASSGNSWDAPLFFIGLGCMFTWISGIQYFEMFPQYYALILTLKKSAPRVLAFLVGVMPVFLGFAYFGVAYFSTGSSLFADVDSASVALFALLNGDVIHDVFDNIYPISPVLSRIYLYTFISLFIYAVLNIFIAIVEDAFFAAKQETEIEIDEDRQQQNFDVHDLDVVGLVAGPPIPITQSMMNLFNQNKNGIDNYNENSLLSGSKKISINNTNITNMHRQISHSSVDSIEPIEEEDDNNNINMNITPKIAPINKTSRDYENELSAPLIASAVRQVGNLSKSEQILLQTHDRDDIRERQKKHQLFLKILSQLITSYNKKFLSEIQQILININIELRPPHSFDNYPCG